MSEMTWEEITPAYRDSLVRFAESYAQRASDAEDVVQDVFVRLLRPGGAQVPERPGAYLRRAVANEAVSHWRRHKRERLVDELPDSGQADGTEAVANRIVVRTAIASLPLRMRQVIVLGFLEGMSDADIASALGITSITVRTTRARALRHLRDLLVAGGSEDLGRPAPALAAAIAVGPEDRPEDRPEEEPAAALLAA